MANFLLVHGGWCLGWVWTDTAAALQEDGHSVTTVDLPSCGTEAAELGDWQADLAAIRLALDEIGASVVMVAHSSGGMSLTEFADHPSVQHGVYLAALWPQRGQSVFDMFGGQMPDWMVVRDDGTAQLSEDPEVVRQALCADIDAERFAAEVYPRYVLQSISDMGTPSTAPQATHPTTYIICEQDQAIPPQAQEAMATAADQVARLPSSHSPFLSMPHELASVLGTAAAK